MLATKKKNNKVSPALVTKESRPRGNSNAGRLTRKSRGTSSGWLMVPGLVLLVGLIVVPLLIAVYSSLTSLDEYTIANWTGAPFVGLANFRVALFNSSAVSGVSVAHSLLVSVEFSLVTTAFITPIGMAGALVASVPSRLQGVIRSVFLIPYAIPPFVTAILWRFVFLNGGVLDRVLSDVHLGSINTFWLLGPNSFWALVIADSWASWPFIFLLVLAGLQSIPGEVYDSACIDGASAWFTFRSITLPFLKRLLLLALLLSTINHLNNFALPYVMFGTPPPSNAEVLPLNVYVTSFSTFDFGVGAAMGLIGLVVLAVPGVLYIRATGLTRRGDLT